MSEKVEISSILDWFKKAVEDGTPISPALWLDGASKINALLGEFDDAYIEAEMSYRVLRSMHIERGTSATEAETRSKASPEYTAYLKFKAQRERITEFIRLAKARTQLAQWDI